MRRLIENLLPTNKQKRKWTAILITSVIAGLLTVLGIYGIEEYGGALFILVPFFTGIGPILLYGIDGKITKTEAWQLGFLTLGIFTLFLIIFAIEGLICIAMAAPLGLIINCIGSLIGYYVIKKKPEVSSATFLILIFFIPITGFIEKEKAPKLTSVTTSIEIHANANTVWRNVIQFPQLEEPTELIFKTGIAYPVNAKIEGTGIGAIRYCNFTTGSFIEPITIWDEPALLKFDVVKQPLPMKELSFWDIDAPHLHDYFVSKKGQFKLTTLSNGNTLLEGTTWYYHDISPTFYWKIWSDFIIHKIHERVLHHIKINAEKETNKAYN